MAWKNFIAKNINLLGIIIVTFFLEFRMHLKDYIYKINEFVFFLFCFFLMRWYIEKGKGFLLNILNESSWHKTLVFMIILISL